MDLNTSGYGLLSVILMMYLVQMFKVILTVPSIEEEELALAILLSVGEMSFKAIAG